MLTTKSFFSTQQYVGCRKEALLIVKFEQLYGVTDESQNQLDQFLNDEITEHLESLETESMLNGIYDKLTTLFVLYEYTLDNKYMERAIQIKITGRQ